MYNTFWHVEDEFDHLAVTAKLKKPADAVDRIIPVGTIVRINMLSRFGDVGITDNVTRETGYDARVGGKFLYLDGQDIPVLNPGGPDDWFENISGMEDICLPNVSLNTFGNQMGITRNVVNLWDVRKSSGDLLEHSIPTRKEAQRIAVDYFINIGIDNWYWAVKH